MLCFKAELQHQSNCTFEQERLGRFSDIEPNDSGLSHAISRLDGTLEDLTLACMPRGQRAYGCGQGKVAFAQQRRVESVLSPQTAVPSLWK